MNGRSLPVDSREMKALAAYIHFLSRGIPIGAEIEGAGTRTSSPPDRKAQGK